MRYELAICGNCTLVAANDDWSGVGPQDPRPLGLLPDTAHVIAASVLTHRDDCTGEECSCWEYGFTNWRCEGCGAPAGDRFLAVIDDDSLCPACGNTIDYCPGHGESGDPIGHAILRGEDLDHDSARAIARDYASSGTIGAVLAEFATTGDADWQALADDVAATITHDGRTDELTALHGYVLAHTLAVTR